MVKRLSVLTLNKMDAGELHEEVDIDVNWTGVLWAIWRVVYSKRTNSEKDRLTLTVRRHPCLVISDRAMNNAKVVSRFPNEIDHQLKALGVKKTQIARGNLYVSPVVGH